MRNTPGIVAKTGGNRAGRSHFPATSFAVPAGHAVGLETFSRPFVQERPGDYVMYFMAADGLKTACRPSKIVLVTGMLLWYTI